MFKKRSHLFTFAIGLLAIGALALCFTPDIHHVAAYVQTHVQTFALHAAPASMMYAIAPSAVALAARQAIETKGEGGVDDDADPAKSVLEIKSLIQRQGEAWEEFKKTNDQLIKDKADGKAVADLEAKLAKITKDMDTMSEIKAQFDQLMAKMQRPGGLGSGGEKQEAIEAECKNFNAYRKCWGMKGNSEEDLTVEQYTAYKSAFFKLARKGSLDHLTDTERKAMLAGSDADGGFLLPTPTVGRIATRLQEISQIRAIASVMTISTDAIEGINDLDEAAAGWVAELGTRGDTNTPQVGKYRIEAHEMYAQPKATQRLLDDASIDVESWLADKVSRRFARLEGSAFIVGDGVGKPRGFTAYPTAATGDSTRAWGTMEHVKSGVNGDFAASSPADVLFTLQQAFKPWYLNNARWVTLRDVIGKIRKFKEATTNAYMWQPGLQAGQPDKLLGYPIVTAQDMPALTTDSLSLAFGDFQEGYQIVDRIGIRMLRDPYTDKPYVKFYSTRRVGGGVLNFEAIKFIKFSA